MYQYLVLLIISDIVFALGWPVGIKNLDIKSLLNPSIWRSYENEILPENTKVT